MSLGGNASDSEFGDEIKDEVLACALKNAVEHDGKAMLGPVMSMLLGKHPELKPKAKELIKIVKEIIEEVNKLGKEEQVKLIKERFPSILVGRKVSEKERKELPPLPNVDKYTEVYKNQTKTMIMNFVPDLGSSEMPQIEGFELLPDEHQGNLMYGP